MGDSAGLNTRPCPGIWTELFLGWRFNDTPKPKKLASFGWGSVIMGTPKGWCFLEALGRINITFSFPESPVYLPPFVRWDSSFSFCEFNKLKI
jgi:hypothetical protein